MSEETKATLLLHFPVQVGNQSVGVCDIRLLGLRQVTSTAQIRFLRTRSGPINLGDQRSVVLAEPPRDGQPNTASTNYNAKRQVGPYM